MGNEQRISVEDESSSTPGRSLFFKKVASASFYGVCSFAITIINKSVLTSYNFPSFETLGLGQMLATIIVLYTAKKFRFIEFPKFDATIITKIWPLPLIYVGNVFFGLGGTKEISLPMFTALRRFSILMTMISELYILGVKPNYGVQISVYTMILGALVAAANDLAFNLIGYVYVLLNNFFSSLNGVYMKKKLDSKELGKYGLMYYNSLFMFVPSLILTWSTGVLATSYNFEGWSDTFFVTQFLISCVMGFVLSYSIVVCTYYNSALTTTVIGCLKNVVVTYIGMIIGGDYIFSWMNFIGLNFSIIGSLMYTYVAFRRQHSAPAYTTLNNQKSDNKLEVI